MGRDFHRVFERGFADRAPVSRAICAAHGDPHRAEYLSTVDELKVHLGQELQHAQIVAEQIAFLAAYL